MDWYEDYVSFKFDYLFFNSVEVKVNVLRDVVVFVRDFIFIIWGRGCFDKVWWYFIIFVVECKGIIFIFCYYIWFKNFSVCFYICNYDLCERMYVVGYKINLGILY